MWFMGIIAAFTRLKPKCSILMVFFSVLTQILTLLAFILPIRILFLFQEPVPVTFFSLTLTSRAETGLIFISLIAFILLAQVLSQRFANSREEKCSRDIWENNRKLLIYADQENLATSMYRRYIRILTGMVLIAVVLLGLLALHPVISAALTGYFLLTGILVTLAAEWSPGLRQYAERHFGRLLNLLSTFGFFLMFLVIVYFVATEGKSGGMILAVITLILFRHILNNAVTVVQGIKSLYENRIRLEAIFFTGQVGHPEPPKADMQMWQLLSPELRSGWMSDILSEVEGRRVTVEKHRWYELGIPNEYAFVVTVPAEGGRRRYLLKVYPKQQKARALREAAILSEPELSWLSLPFAGTFEFAEQRCNVFEYEEIRETEPSVFAVQRELLNEKLLSVSPPRRLLEQYVGTHKLLCQRLEPSLFERLAVAVDGERERKALARLEQSLVRDRALMRKLPLRIVVTGITKNMLRETPDGKPVVLSVGQWQIEPLGFGFGDSAKEKAFLRRIAEKTGECAPLVEIVSQYYGFENDIRRNCFRAALRRAETMAALSENVRESCGEEEVREPAP